MASSTGRVVQGFVLHPSISDTPILLRVNRHKANCPDRDGNGERETCWPSNPLRDSAKPSLLRFPILQVEYSAA